MFYPLSILSLILLILIHLTHGHSHNHMHTRHSSSEDVPGTPFETRAYWMRRAISALSELESPCPFAAFGTAIVNHTDTGVGEKGRLVCLGVNSNLKSGNPTLHGEIAAINNCSRILTDPEGDYRLSPEEALKAWKDLTLYTTAEACPMCASAIRWSGFKEYIYATSIDKLFEKGWGQISISSTEVFQESEKLPGNTVLIGDILANETDQLFSWQFDERFPCPSGCERDRGKFCVPVKHVEHVLDREL